MNRNEVIRTLAALGLNDEAIAKALDQGAVFKLRTSSVYGNFNKRPSGTISAEAMLENWRRIVDDA